MTARNVGETVRFLMIALQLSFRQNTSKTIGRDGFCLSIDTSREMAVNQGSGAGESNPP
jgi:hypothetical protein